MYICNRVLIKPTINGKSQGYVVVNTERCKGCNLCVVSCPTDVLELQPREVNNKGYHFVYMKIRMNVLDVLIVDLCVRRVSYCNIDKKLDKLRHPYMNKSFSNVVKLKSNLCLKKYR